MRDQVGQSVELHEGVSSVEGRRFGDHAALARIARESQRTRAREGIRRVGDARGTVQARSTRARTPAAIADINAVQSFACKRKKCRLKSENHYVSRWGDECDIISKSDWQVYLLLFLTMIGDTRNAQAAHTGTSTWHTRQRQKRYKNNKQLQH